MSRHIPQSAVVPRELLFAFLVPPLLLLPFLDKAIHIDDPIFLWTAKRILTHPLDFYGFHLNWYGTLMPMYEVNQNPPLTSYYLALAGATLGWRESALHLAMCLPAGLCGAGMYLLARHFCRQPLPAALILTVTPAFLVSSTTLMSDVFMLMFFLWAMVFWLEGLRARRYRWLLLSGLAIALASLSKYFAASLVPLLLVHALFSGRGNRRAAWILLIPVVLVGAYEYWTFHLYGRGLFFDAIRYASVIKADYLPDYNHRGMMALGFLGACAAPILFYAVYLWSGFACLMGLAVAAAVAVTVVVLDRDTAPGIAGQIGAWTAAGIAVLLLALSDVWRRRDSLALLLVLWVGGTICFVVFVNHLVNVRVILPAVPAIAILMVRKIEDRGLVQSQYRRAVPAWPLLPAVALALCVAYADMSLANAARRVAIEAPVGEQAGAKTWFGGHWGFQYYMEARGAEPVNTAMPMIRPGDLVIVPRNNTNPISLPDEIVAERTAVEADILPWLATMQPEVGAGFYAEVWGPLPFVFAPVPPEQYQVILLGPALAPQST